MVEAVATDIERLALNWLDKHRIDYLFQTSLAGGYYELGGMVIDILLPDRWIAIRVMGEYWHKGVEPEGKAIIQREQLEAMGWTVVDCWGEDLQSRLDETMSKAILGEEVL